jgi:hypothetical protein
MTVKEAKEKAVKTGSCELLEGVYLMTGRQARKDAVNYKNGRGGYWNQDIDINGLYLLTSTCLLVGNFENIEKVLNNN